LRTFRSAALVCTLFILAGISAAQIQEVDIAVGGGTTFSARPTSASEAFQPPAQRGGLYPSVSAQVTRGDNFGLNAEFDFRYKEATYNGFQRYRPTQYDVNLVYAPDVNKKTKVDIMAGVGGQTTIFYNTFNSCNANAGACTVHFNSTHFALHVGFDVRRYIWRNYFIRPEVHYFRIIDNSEFHSDNLIRVGATIGYSWGR